MSEAVKTLIQKIRYDEVICTVITDAIDLDFYTIDSQPLLNGKDKTFTYIKLINTVESIIQIV